MRRPHGYVSVVGGWRDAEFDAITCGHCQQIVLVKPGTASTVYLVPQALGPMQEEPGAMCRVCMTPVCLSCHDDGRCLPAMKRIEAIERQRTWHDPLPSVWGITR